MSEPNNVFDLFSNEFEDYDVNPAKRSRDDHSLWLSFCTHLPLPAGTVEGRPVEESYEVLRDASFKCSSDASQQMKLMPFFRSASAMFSVARLECAEMRILVPTSI